MALAWLLLLTGLTISAVAIYYSVIGLTAIFAAAVIPIIVMGSILEVGKLVAAWWLKANWHRAPFLLKNYMLLAVIVLMMITSMGIFGFLSKAHTEQGIPVGDNQARIEIIDERIAIEQEIIAQARQDLTILNQQIERFSELGAVTRGVNARNQQRAEREALTNQILQAQERISEFRIERAPFATSLRAIEAEVGPIKYIAKLIYGDSADANMLEQAVIWIIILIVIVFDPLAIVMLLAAQLTFQWHRREKEDAVERQEPTYARDDGPLTNDQIAQLKASAEGNSLTTESDQNIVEEATVTNQDIDSSKQSNDNYEHTQTEVPSETPSTALGGDITAPEEPAVPDTTESELEKWNKMIEEAERAVQSEKTHSTVEERVGRGETFIDGEGKEVTLEADFPEPSKKKTYMIKDDSGTLQIKEKK